MASGFPSAWLDFFLTMSWPAFSENIFLGRLVNSLTPSLWDMFLKTSCQCHNSGVSFLRTWKPFLWNIIIKQDSIPLWPLSSTFCRKVEALFPANTPCHPASCKTTSHQEDMRKFTFPLGKANFQTQVV